jgi:hypothetical protein
MRLVFVAFALVASVGCTHVHAYERGKLAHPTMTTEALEGPAHQHMYAVHEGAVGGTGAAESGCGCN